MRKPASGFSACRKETYQNGRYYHINLGFRILCLYYLEQT